MLEQGSVYSRVAAFIRSVMCILATDSHPKSTRLFSIPVVVAGQPWTCLIYTNDMEVDADKPALMIVPFPNLSSRSDFGLFNVSKTKGFRRQVVRAFKKYETTTKNISRRNARSMADSFVPVLEVGNYRCSVVSNAEALATSIDWSKFHTPADLEQRLSVVSDPELNGGCGFVVAEAFRSVRDDGFGIVFPGRHVFFPTCHEGNESGFHDYDVCCYGFNAEFAWPGSVTSPVTLPYAPYKSTDDHGLDGVLNMLPRDLYWSTTGKKFAMDVDAVTSVAFMHVQGCYANANVRGSCLESPGDTARAIALSRVGSTTLPSSSWVLTTPGPE